MKCRILIKAAGLIKGDHMLGLPRTTPLNEFKKYIRWDTYCTSLRSTNLRSFNPAANFIFIFYSQI